ncbi:MAG: DsbA family protein [Alphaproteobacteria bacterium]|nr:DsbA family protein [Alphaproteobacteria bacterium]
MAILRTLAAAGAAALMLSACSGASSSGDGRSAYEREGDRAIGNPDAPVTMVEYASVACGGCAAWHASAKPTVDEYIESGDVRYVFREMITGQPNLAIAGFMLASCAPEDRYFDVIDLLFEQQRALFTAMQQGRAQAQFQTIARTAGFSDEEFRACMQSEDNLQAVRDASERASEEGIASTPTFFLNGDLLEAGSSPDADGPVYTVNGQPLVDDQGPIPATFEGETFERIILYYKARAEGSASGGDGGAE